VNEFRRAGAADDARFPSKGENQDGSEPGENKRRGLQKKNASGAATVFKTIGGTEEANRLKKVSRTQHNSLEEDSRGEEGEKLNHEGRAPANFRRI